MNQSKFTNWTSGKGFRIPAAALELAKIMEGERLDFHVADDVIVDYVCPSGLTKADYVDLTPEVREAVGIPANAKLQMTLDPNHAAVTISEAEYKADLSDVPEVVLDLLESMDVRLCVLERHLMKGDVIHE